MYVASCIELIAGYLSSSIIQFLLCSLDSNGKEEYPISVKFYVCVCFALT